MVLSQTHKITGSQGVLHTLASSGSPGMFDSGSLSPGSYWTQHSSLISLDFCDSRTTLVACDMSTWVPSSIHLYSILIIPQENLIGSSHGILRPCYVYTWRLCHKFKMISALLDYCTPEPLVTTTSPSAFLLHIPHSSSLLVWNHPSPWTHDPLSAWLHITLKILTLWESTINTLKSASPFKWTTLPGTRWTPIWCIHHSNSNPPEPWVAQHGFQQTLSWFNTWHSPTSLLATAVGMDWNQGALNSFPLLLTHMVQLTDEPLFPSFTFNPVQLTPIHHSPFPYIHPHTSLFDSHSTLSSVSMVLWYHASPRPS